MAQAFYNPMGEATGPAHFPGHPAAASAPSRHAAGYAQAPAAPQVRPGHQGPTNLEERKAQALMGRGQSHGLAQPHAQPQPAGVWGATFLQDKQMMSLGANAAGHFFSNNVGQLTPGVSSFYRSLRYYFSVNHSYVMRKLGILLLPFRKKRWAREAADDDGDLARKYARPVHDENAPDLYIPLMALVTFVLGTGFLKGAAGKFSPDVLQRVMTSCAVADLLLMLLMQGALFFTQLSVPSLDLYAYVGYKYFGLCIVTVAGLSLGSWGYYVSLFYMAAALGFFSLKTFAQAVQGPRGGDNPQRSMVVLTCAALQPLSMFWLGGGW